MKNYSCSNCGIINCKHQDTEYPKFCPTKELTSDEIFEIEKLYNEDNNKEISRISAEIEEEFYCKYTRVEEIIEFAKRLKMKKIGIVTDSHSGIKQEEAKRLGIKVLPMPFYIEEECFYENIPHKNPYPLVRYNEKPNMNSCKNSYLPLFFTSFLF